MVRSSAKIFFTHQRSEIRRAPKCPLEIWREREARIEAVENGRKLLHPPLEVVIEIAMRRLQRLFRRHVKWIVRVADQVRKHSQTEDHLRHRLVCADQRNNGFRFALDALTQMRPMNVRPLLGQRAIDSRTVLIAKTENHQAEIARRELRRSNPDLLIGGSGPGVCGEWNEKEEEESFHQRTEW